MKQTTILQGSSQTTTRPKTSAQRARMNKASPATSQEILQTSMMFLALRKGQSESTTSVSSSLSFNGRSQSSMIKASTSWPATVSIGYLTSPVQVANDLSDRAALAARRNSSAKSQQSNRTAFSSTTSALKKRKNRNKKRLARRCLLATASLQASRKN